MGTWQSAIFPLKQVSFTTGEELVMRGNRDLFHLLPTALWGVEQIGFIGWGSQAPAQAQNLRDSLAFAGSDIKVAVGLRDGSNSIASAKEAGFNAEKGTLGEMFKVVANSDMVMFLISDGPQTEHWRAVMKAMKPGSTLCFSHGFLYGHMESIGASFRPDINVIMMAPKGMGASVRILYEMGRKTTGAGINSSVAVEQDLCGRATDYALAWALGTGSPATFFTTMRHEVISDLTGERSMLLGGFSGLVEALYQFFLSNGQSEKEAFLHSAKGLTSTISAMISNIGLWGMAEFMSSNGYHGAFKGGYNKAYPIMRRVIADIYANVASWEEIAEVVQATKALETTPMPDIEKARMWRVAKELDLYGYNVPMSRSLAFSAGAYVAGMMAQMEILREHGHSTSEVINESLIEAIDSLNPFMDSRGLSYMVDSCSITARLGTRKWGPVFTKRLVSAFELDPNDQPLYADDFCRSPLHEDIKTCFGLRPSVKISVT